MSLFYMQSVNWLFYLTTNIRLLTSVLVITEEFQPEGSESDDEETIEKDEEGIDEVNGGCNNNLHLCSYSYLFETKSHRIDFTCHSGAIVLVEKTSVLCAGRLSSLTGHLYPETFQIEIKSAMYVSILIHVCTVKFII